MFYIFDKKNNYFVYKLYNFRKFSGWLLTKLSVDSFDILVLNKF